MSRSRRCSRKLQQNWKCWIIDEALELRWTAGRFARICRAGALGLSRQTVQADGSLPKDNKRYQTIKRFACILSQLFVNIFVICTNCIPTETMCIYIYIIHGYSQIVLRLQSVVKKRGVPCTVRCGHTAHWHSYRPLPRWRLCLRHWKPDASRNSGSNKIWTCLNMFWICLNKDVEHAWVKVLLWLCCVSVYQLLKVFKVRTRHASNCPENYIYSL